MTDAAGITGWGQRDDRGRLVQMGGPAGGYNYAYDLVGNLTRISGTKYTYDTLNRLSTVTAQIGNNFITMATYGYDNLGNLATVTYGSAARRKLTEFFQVEGGHGVEVGWCDYFDASGQGSKIV